MTPLLPGAVGLTYLRVYDRPGPDGLAGGSPHLHLACTEAYLVTRGAGWVETLCAAGLQRHRLEPGRVVWFSPGVIHRLENESGDLEIMVVMQNAGLPEAGDFVLCFAPEVLSDPAAYARLASLASGDRVYATDEQAATARRDAAVRGYLGWRERFAADGAAALEPLYAAAVALIQPRLPGWMGLWSAGPRAAAMETGEQLNELVSGRWEHLTAGRSAEMAGPSDRGRLGMCGRLEPYLPEGVSLA